MSTGRMGGPPTTVSLYRVGGVLTVVYRERGGPPTSVSAGRVVDCCISWVGGQKSVIYVVWMRTFCP